MSTAAPEVDLVNAALLGTDRRALPVADDADAAGWLLEAAARRRAAHLVAAPSTVARPGAPGPAERRPVAPLAARVILDEVLAQPSSAVLDLWLREALAAGSGLAPEHWAPVLDRARRSTELDRRRLGAALGPRGLWFARHNPAWSAVVRAAEVPAAAAGPDLVGDPGDEDLAALAGDPDRLLTWPDPWSTGVTRVAVGLLIAGVAPVRGARSLGQRFGTRLPLAAYGAVAGAAPTRTDPASTASARAGLAAAEEVLWVRWALAHAFDPARVPPDRRPFPSVPTPQERP